ncbi:helix-turn-helix domain-containing protein [Verrucomicrobiota bacterium sgz303538]
MNNPSISSQEVYRVVGARIRGERIKQKLTQEELASLVKLKRTSITNIEKGRQKLLLHTLVEIAAALGVSPLELLSPLNTDETAKFNAPLPPDLPADAKDWIIAGVAAARNRVQP